MLCKKISLLSIIHHTQTHFQKLIKSRKKGEPFVTIKFRIQRVHMLTISQYQVDDKCLFWKTKYLYDRNFKHNICLLLICTNIQLDFRPVTGRFVSFYKEESITLTICEFEIYGQSVHPQDGKYKNSSNLWFQTSFSPFPLSFSIISQHVL